MTKSASAPRRNYLLSLGILAGMFFIFGAVSWVNSILIPYFRICCELTHFESYFVSFAFYIAYFIMAVPSGILLKKVGFKRGIMYGFMLTALGAFVFVPAALFRQFEIFLLGLFCIGTGLAVLQTAANPYVTILGPIESAAQRMSVMGVFNKTAGIIAPLILAALILRPEDSELFALIDSGTLDAAAKAPLLDGLIRRVIVPYAVLGVLLAVLLAVLLVFIGKTFVILGQPGGAVSAALPAGATDLAAREVSGTAEEVGEHVFATGTARLVVSADAPVTVRLWQVRETRENTMVATLDAKHRSCIFTNLPPQTLYAVTVDGAPDVQLTVRSRLTFREAFSLMLQEL